MCYCATLMGKDITAAFHVNYTSAPHGSGSADASLPVWKLLGDSEDDHVYEVACKEAGAHEHGQEIVIFSPAFLEAVCTAKTALELHTVLVLGILGPNFLVNLTKMVYCNAGKYNVHQLRLIST